ncbi:IS3 family transposase [Salmonella enterica subsp. enterica serovar Offa]
MYRLPGTLTACAPACHCLIQAHDEQMCACAESFFHTLKVECIHGEDFATREIMRTAVFNYIECDYNRWRRHSACGGLSPEQFENQNLA